MQYNHSSFGVIGGRVQVTQWRGGGMPITTIAYHGGAELEEVKVLVGNRFQIRKLLAGGAGKKIRCML